MLGYFRHQPGQSETFLTRIFAVNREKCPKPLKTANFDGSLQTPFKFSSKEPRSLDEQGIWACEGETELSPKPAQITKNSKIKLAKLTNFTLQHPPTSNYSIVSMNCSANLELGALPKRLFKLVTEFHHASG